MSEKPTDLIEPDQHTQMMEAPDSALPETIAQSENSPTETVGRQDPTVAIGDDTALADEAASQNRAVDDPTRTLDPPGDPNPSKVVSHSMETIAVSDENRALQDKILKQMEDAADADIGPDPLLGAEIAGRFKVESRIGEGGMGVVYKASQKNMDRAVAIKVLLAEMAANKTVVKRFRREALAVSKLRHPNTIQIFDFGETDAGQLYIAMEFLDGKALKDILRDERRLAVSRALRVTIQMLRSLREAHAQGIVHRDLKPDNVFLCRVGEDPDFVKVLDFGVAKIREGNKEEASLTKTGAIFGTPRYMSPEQSVSSNVDPRSDLYAIGVMLYEMLTGRAPFEAEMPLSLLIMHVQDAVPLCSEVAPDVVIPTEVEQLVRKLLEKKADDRFQTAEGAIRAMESLLDDLDPIYRTVVTQEHAEKIGLEVQNPVHTLQNTNINPSHPQMVKTMAQAPDADLTGIFEPKKKRTLLWVALLLLVPLMAAGGVYVGMEPLPNALTADRQLTALPKASISQLKPVSQLPLGDISTVAIDIQTTPAGVEIWDGDRRIGTTPFKMERLKSAGKVRNWTLKKEGFKEHRLAIKPDSGLTQSITMVAVEKVATAPPVKRRTKSRKKKPTVVVKPKVITKTITKTIVKTKVVTVAPKKKKKKKKASNPFGRRVDDTK